MSTPSLNVVVDGTDLKGLVDHGEKEKNEYKELLESLFGGVNLKWRDVKKYTRAGFVQKYGKGNCAIADKLESWIHQYGLEFQKEPAPDLLGAPAATAKHHKFMIPTTIASPNHRGRFEERLKVVNQVDHGEFQDAVTAVLKSASGFDAGLDRPPTLAIQRCRRGGKTFMLSAVASRLEKHFEDDESASSEEESKGTTYIVSITMNSDTWIDSSENARTAILSRIAWEIAGRENALKIFKRPATDFDGFLAYYDNFDEIIGWLQKNKVILLVDELNLITPGMENYAGMSRMLNELVGREGSCLLYATHLRNTVDWLRGRTASDESKDLPRRRHRWLEIPRIRTDSCLLGMPKNASSQSSFWGAVLRGRIPALMMLKEENVDDYAKNVIVGGDEEAQKEDRIKCLTAAITGKIGDLASGRNLFKAYSYMSDREDKSKDPAFAWPPFMLAQKEVLGHDYPILRTSLETPDLTDAKAFEALTELAVLLRLLTNQTNVPLIPDAPSDLTDGLYCRWLQFRSLNPFLCMTSSFYKEAVRMSPFKFHMGISARKAPTRQMWVQTPVFLYLYGLKGSVPNIAYQPTAAASASVHNPKTSLDG